MGRPLIYWAINAAHKSKVFDKIYVSTDSEKISKIINKYKVDILKRSKTTSDDKATIHDVIRETILKLDLKKTVNICCLLPTAVLVDHKMINFGFRTLKNNK